MTIPANVIIAQNQLLYKKTTPPVIFTVLCNCSASRPVEHTARFVSANRHLYWTPEQYKQLTEQPQK
jgi:hypothetical protein